VVGDLGEASSLSSSDLRGVEGLEHEALAHSAAYLCRLSNQSSTYCTAVVVKCAGPVVQITSIALCNVNPTAGMEGGGRKKADG